MSGIYIPNMEMPTRCFACSMCDMGCCGISKGPYIEYRDVDIELAMNARPDWCPLVPVPDHGRLIDADALIQDSYKKARGILEESMNPCDRAVVISAVKCSEIIDAPTIIPADKEAT